MMSIGTAVGDLFDGFVPSIILIASTVLLLCWHRLSVKLDPQEPPMLKPTIPYIGHVIGLAKHQIKYYDILFASSPRPICTLPIINSKKYVITDPTLAQAAFRSKNLTLEPFLAEFSKRIFALSSEELRPMLEMPADENAPSFTSEMIKEIHGSLMGENLHQMNVSALAEVALKLNSIDIIKPDSLYLWLREMMTLATSHALFGSHNPLVEDGLVKDLWDFQTHINMLFQVFNFYPSITARTAFKARARVQSALGRYYTAKYDQEPDVSQLVRGRAVIFRKYCIPPTDIGKFELGLMGVATINAIPTLFWLLCHVCADSSLINSIREELVAMITPSEFIRPDGKREFSINISKFESDCPLFVSTYRETIRISNAQLSFRFVTKDTTITDGTKAYLLKEGHNVELPSGVPHLSPNFWGPDSTAFNPRRFMKPILQTEKQKQEDKMQKRAYFPFGGGRNLCPGRNFAFAEILGAVALLLLGFDIESGDGSRIVVPEMERTRFTAAISAPEGEAVKMGAKVSRRKGWEDVIWKFVA